MNRNNNYNNKDNKSYINKISKNIIKRTQTAKKLKNYQKKKRGGGGGGGGACLCCNSTVIKGTAKTLKAATFMILGKITTSITALKAIKRQLQNKITFKESHSSR